MIIRQKAIIIMGPGGLMAISFLKIDYIILASSN
jgi:hypothetical protein